MYEKIELYSKRNKVYKSQLNGSEVVYKTFSNKDNLLKEIQILRLLKENVLNVPEIIEVDGDTLCMEYIGDLTLLDWVEKKEKSAGTDYDDILEKLSEWLHSYYRITSEFFEDEYILFDVNFRNFIIKEGEIYGVDFEQSGFGNIEEDIGKLAAFSLMYAPEKTEWKIKFADYLIDFLSEKLEIKKNLIIVEMENELDRMKLRRADR